MLMNKLTVALIACGFALMSVTAMADDKTPSTTTPADQAQMKADAAAKKAASAQMTAEEKAAAKKAARAKKQSEADTMIKAGNPNPNAKAKADAKAVEASKAQPKVAPDAKAKLDAEKSMEKNAGKSQ
jgi:hypothetical protein